ncbi:hypothetical protein BC629DRAFT_1571961 [Irpex lacteus]|nr:hypothetical protein BC629DRAFT_1571961 [Irpex lacteus]
MSDGVTDKDPANVSGHIPYISVGARFASRKELAEARVHPPLEHGIFRGPGGSDEPAKSIVMANRPEYPNDDRGERFTYIGMGGHDGPEEDAEDDGKDGEKSTKRRKKRRNTHGGLQTSHQSFSHPMNKALKVAAELGTLVRVTRGAGVSEFAPYEG